MLLAKARSDGMLAHYAVRHNIIHEVNITAEGNIICLQGQASFSVMLQAEHHAIAWGFHFYDLREPTMLSFLLSSSDNSSKGTRLWCIKARSSRESDSGEPE